MVTLSDPYRRLASQGGDDQGGLAGAVRDQSGRSVEVECKFFCVSERVSVNVGGSVSVRVCMGV